MPLTGLFETNTLDPETVKYITNLVIAHALIMGSIIGFALIIRN
jgi:hypothetical protein